MIYKGSCHCGRIAFEVDGELIEVADCNCSICTKQGSLHWFVPRQKLRLATSEHHLSTYAFGERTISYRFCPNCGTHPFAEGPDSAGNAMAAVNVRCLDGIELSDLPVKHFNGRAL
jgi:hypothetical protein